MKKYLRNKEKMKCLSIPNHKSKDRTATKNSKAKITRLFNQHFLIFIWLLMIFILLSIRVHIWFISCIICKRVVIRLILISLRSQIKFSLERAVLPDLTYISLLCIRILKVKTCIANCILSIMKYRWWLEMVEYSVKKLLIHQLDWDL